MKKTEPAARKTDLKGFRSPMKSKKVGLGFMKTDFKSLRSATNRKIELSAMGNDFKSLRSAMK